MAYEYNQISTPVSIYDLQQAVGTGASDLAQIIINGGTLFAGTPRWNLHKPTKGSSKLFNLTDAELYALDCGLNVPQQTSQVLSGGNGIGVVVDSSVAGGAYFVYSDGPTTTKICNVHVPWTYKGVPTGGASDPYRISDFVDTVNNTSGFLTTPVPPIQILVETVQGEKDFLDTDDDDMHPRIVYTITGYGYLMILKKLYSLLHINATEVNAGFVIIDDHYTTYGVDGDKFIYPISNIPVDASWEITRPFNNADVTAGVAYNTAICIGMNIDTSQGKIRYIVPLDADFFVSGSAAFKTIIPTKKTSRPDQINVTCYGFVHYENGVRHIYFKGEAKSIGDATLSGVTAYMQINHNATIGATKSMAFRTSSVTIGTMQQDVTYFVMPTSIDSGSVSPTLSIQSVTDPNTGLSENYVMFTDPETPSQTDDSGPEYYFVSIYVTHQGTIWNKQNVTIMSYNEFFGIA